jgi:hypothetical protein
MIYSNTFNMMNEFGWEEEKIKHLEKVNFLLVEKLKKYKRIINGLKLNQDSLTRGK